jgi:type IV pilus assembly protein PilN
MRISINLATRPFTDLGPILRQLRIAMGVLAVLSLGFWIGLHFFHAAAEKARARAHSLDGEFAKINAEQQGYDALMRQPENARVLSEAQALNQLFDEKTFSWTLAMEDLETVLPGGVQVTTLEPSRDPKTGVITVKMRIQGPRDKNIDLVKNLEHSKRFINARIVDESVENSTSSAQKMEPISASMKANFNLQADYSLPSEEESKAIIKKQRKPIEEPSAVNKRGPYPGGVAPVHPPVQPTTILPRPNGNIPGRPLPGLDDRPRPRQLRNDPEQQERLHQRPVPIHPQPGQPSQPQPSPSGGVQ